MSAAVLLLTGFSATAQETLTLDDCIQIGLSNNITIKQVNNNSLIAAANEKQSKLEYLPRVSAFSNYNIRNYGNNKFL